MPEGLSYTEAARLAAKHNPLILNPLERDGNSRIWRASKRARTKGLVRIVHVKAGVAHIFPVKETPHVV